MNEKTFTTICYVLIILDSILSAFNLFAGNMDMSIYLVTLAILLAQIVQLIKK